MYTKGELLLVSETEYDHIIYLRDKPNRRDKIVARFISRDDALLSLASGDMYEALKESLLADKKDFYTVVGEVDGNKVNAKGMARYHMRQALTKADGK